MSWITFDPQNLILIAVSVIGAYIALITFTRLSGVRAFSKMSAFDFAVTVAIGSILASIVISDSPPLLQGISALGMIFALQMGIAVARVHWPALTKIVDNDPRLIMYKGKIIEEQMTAAKITKEDLYAKLREANVLDFDQIHAVIAETTGGVSVMHSTDPDETLNTELLQQVIGFTPDLDETPAQQVKQ